MKKIVTSHFPSLKKNKRLFVSILIFIVLSVIVIETIIIIRHYCKSPDIIDNIVNIFFGLVGVVALILSILYNLSSKKDNKKLTDKIDTSQSSLGKTTEHLKSIGETLEETTVQVEAIAKHLSFSSINPFPYGLLDVIEILNTYKDKAKDDKKKKFYLDIYTDVPGYAIFGHNKLWNRYYKCLENIFEELKDNFPIHWYFYSNQHLEKQIEGQFNNWKGLSLGALKDEIYIRSGYNEKMDNRDKYEKLAKEINKEKYKNRFHYLHEQKCKFCSTGNCLSVKDEGCKIILRLKNEVDELKTKEEIEDFVQTKVFETMRNLHKHAIEKIEGLSGLGVIKYKEKRLNEDLPFFAWIILEKNNDTEEDGKKLVPIEGIVSYNYYDEKKEAIEKGFRTSDRKLIRSLYDIVHSNAIQQLEKQYRNEVNKQLN